jgi:hypothetical protein
MCVYHGRKSDRVFIEAWGSQSWHGWPLLWLLRLIRRKAADVDWIWRPVAQVGGLWLGTPRWHRASDPRNNFMIEYENRKRIGKSSFVKVEATAQTTKCWCVLNIVSPSKTWQDWFGLIFLKWQEEMFSPKWLYPNEHPNVSTVTWHNSSQLWGPDSPWRL